MITDNIPNANDTQINPCVRNCCLDERDICLGCGRILSEILEWHRSDSKRRHEILQLAKSRLSEHQIKR